MKLAEERLRGLVASSARLVPTEEDHIRAHLLPSF
jgi:hypothetical protein